MMKKFPIICFMYHDGDVLAAAAKYDAIPGGFICRIWPTAGLMKHILPQKN